MTEKQYILGFLLLLVMGFSGWYYVQQNTRTANSNQNKTQPDFYVYGMTSSQFDKNGKLINKIVSPELTHYPEKNTFILLAPRIFVQRDEQQQPWNIAADHGKAENGSQTITLWNNVHLQQIAGKSNNQTTITTNKLVYFPNKKFAETDQAIKIVQPGMEINSIGMQAYLDQGDVKLLSKAEGQYNPVIAKAVKNA